MSLDELNTLLPPISATDADGVWLATDTWLTYHTSIQGDVCDSNTPSKPLASHSQKAKQAQHDYEVLQP
jgi:hypothetical protein